MTIEKKHPSLERTAAALAEFEKVWDSLDLVHSDAMYVEWLQRDKAAREALGRAFYEDTKDRNNLSGAMAAGEEVDTLRRWVQEWKDQEREDRS
jgi:hypothetical protein